MIEDLKLVDVKTLRGENAKQGKSDDTPDARDVWRTGANIRAAGGKQA
jgi:hypothetical protein